MSCQHLTHHAYAAAAVLHTCAVPMHGIGVVYCLQLAILSMLAVCMCLLLSLVTCWGFVISISLLAMRATMLLAGVRLTFCARVGSMLSI